jgi:hypothetical protein
MEEALVSSKKDFDEIKRKKQESEIEKIVRSLLTFRKMILKLSKRKLKKSSINCLLLIDLWTLSQGVTSWGLKGKE